MLQQDWLWVAGILEALHPQVPTASPHRRLGVCKAELHLHYVLGAQPQMGTEQSHEDRMVPLILQSRKTLGRVHSSSLPLFSGDSAALPMCQGTLTAALRGPGSGVPFSSSSWMAVARMGTLWGDVGWGGIVRRAQQSGASGKFRCLLMGNCPCPSIPSPLPKWQGCEDP